MATKFGFGTTVKPNTGKCKEMVQTLLYYQPLSLLSSCNVSRTFPQHIKDIVNQWVVSSNTFVFGLTRLFGIEMEGPREERKEPEPAKEES
jgi:hypothetical protein